MEGRRRGFGHGALLLLAAAAYLQGLSSPHIPKNGDEYPYTHITRKTAESGHLLPLRSELPGVRNTKPPLLFWQGILATDGGRSFDLWHLRLPSVVYTLLTGLLLLRLGARLGGGRETGFVAALVYLAFFSTYRYGRPFLTNAPEVFWLFVPLFVLLHGRPASFASRLRVPALIGVATGIGLLYKSFALAVPVGLGLICLHHLHRRSRGERLAGRDVGGIAVAVLIALLVFALWLLLDPDPAAVWSEFVLGENLGKFDLGGSYLSGLLYGRFSVVALALGFFLNAGLLLPLLLALSLGALRRRGRRSDDERMLWGWVLVFFAVFCLPSQRSSRYLLPAMPAVALLLALSWERIRRRAFVVSLALTGIVLAAMLGLSLLLQRALSGPGPYPVGHWALLAAALGLVLWGLGSPSRTRPLLLFSVFATFCSFSSLVRPLDGPLGRFDDAVVADLAGQDVWVPVDFIGKEEGYRFLLPGAHVHGYPRLPQPSLDALLLRYPRVVARGHTGPLECEACRLLGERFDLGGRHRPQELREMLEGHLLDHLLVREVVVEENGVSP
jgi:4-amino-4-deoxy-L-arabinose transferase-like glycosyltransferase